MNLNSKKPEKRPLYVYYIIAVVIIVLLNVFALPALSERSVKETDYNTFLKAVDRGYRLYFVGRSASHCL